MSKQKEVITIKGEKLPISQCRKFPTGYYKIGNTNEENSGDCYIINKSCYRAETGNIVFNHSTKEYTMNKNNLVNGIVGFENNQPIFGHFDAEGKAEIGLENGEHYYILDEKLLENNREYREELSSGIYYHIKRLPANAFNKIIIPSQEYKTSLPYDSRGITDAFTEKYNKFYESRISNVVKTYAPILEDVSFGLEFETTRGFIPDRILNKVGLIPLRDGSISGIEYVTIPLSGEKGLQTVVDMLEPLKERTVYDNTCSLHLHIGNVPRTKEFILAFFKLTCLVQDDMYQMFPLYKKYNFKVKNKNYSKPYPIFDLLSRMDAIITRENINENFNVLFEYLSQGQPFAAYNNDLDKVKVHPSDPNNNQKWNIHTRYYIHNLIPLIFGNKTTVEFRIHTPTYEVNKIVPFILMSAILVNFTKKYQKNILENKNFLYGKDLRRIITEYLNTSNVSNRDSIIMCMDDYLSVRKQVTESNNCRGDIIGKEEHIRVSKYLDFNKRDIHIPINLKEIKRAKQSAPKVSMQEDDYISAPITINPIAEVELVTKVWTDKMDEGAHKNMIYNSTYSNSKSYVNLSKQMLDDAMLHLHNQSKANAIKQDLEFVDPIKESNEEMV
ncbi:MAG TPA: hypothetical protein VF680_17190 [Allosphingosinicella sp.]